MTKANARLDALKAAGINTDGMFSIHLKNGVTVDVNVHDTDEVSEQIMENGTLNNEKLYRRWVCAQMIRILDKLRYKNAYGDIRYYSFNEYMNDHYNWVYQLRMMEDEYKTLARMKKDGDDELDRRMDFFHPNKVVRIYREIADQISNRVEDEIGRERHHKCHGTPYIFFCREMFFFDDARRRVKQLNDVVDHLATLAEYELFAEMRKEMIKFRELIPYGIDAWNLKKSATWIDAYKGAGAYYTLQNLILFHDAKVVKKCGGVVEGFVGGEDAYEYLNAVADMNANDGWFILGLLKETVDNNGINSKNLY